MRLTLRILAGTMNAIECGLDEICNESRRVFGSSGKHYLALVEARKKMKIARQAVMTVIDAMTDDGEGE